MVYAENLNSDGSFEPEHLGYITFIFEDITDSRFRIWETQKYNEATEFIKKLCVRDMDVIPPKELITYDSLVEEDTHQ